MMILNKFGAFIAGRNKVRLIPYKHHIDGSWMVTIITGVIDPIYYHYAVCGGDNEQAAENAYGCFLREREEHKLLEGAPMRELDEGRMKKPKKHMKYKDVKGA